MAFERESELRGRDADPVVRHLDPGETAVLDRDRHGRRARIQGVLDELLDDGGRPIHDLARRDAFDGRRVQAANGRSGGRTRRRHGGGSLPDRARFARPASSFKRRWASSGDSWSVSIAPSSATSAEDGELSSARSIAWV